MRCYGCGFNITIPDAPSDKRCNACGAHLVFDADDFLLRQHGAAGRDVRVGQVEMGRLVERAIREHAIAFIEAPVGSGKSDAYGVSAVITASPDSEYTIKNYTGSLPSKVAEQVKFKPRIVISTAKKNLQHQVAEKDLPFIKARHGEGAGPIPIALLKGKNNYGCQLKGEKLKEPDRSQFLAWLSSTPSQDLADYVGKRPSYFSDITADDCVGDRCHYAETCGYRRAKKAAGTASIVVTNHHVVALDLNFGPCTLLGPYTTLILDEAHQAPSSFRAALSQQISELGYKRIVRASDKAGVGISHTDDLKAAWEKMFAAFQAVTGEIPKDPFGPLGDETLHVLSEISVAVKAAIKDVEALPIPEGTPPQTQSKRIASLLVQLYPLEKVADRAMQALQTAKNPGDNTVLSADVSEYGNKKLTLAPISVGRLVGPKLQMIPSVIVTSATMAIGGKFEDAKYQFGLNWESYNDEEGNPKGPKPIHELVLSTPFNYDKQAILYTPRHIPLPVGDKHPDRLRYISALSNECSRLIQASDGNAFILFTAKQDLLDVHAALQEEGLSQPLIIQEEDAASTLKQFMATPHSVLMGVKSFWEGVDVQGQKLQLVIITKLPFPPLTDPILQARSRQLVAEQVAKGVPATTASGQTFSKLQIPHMLTELRQGAGRLIRSRTDKGVLAILDPRMFTGNSKDRPLPTQTSYRGYGKLVADATGFGNRVFDFEVISRVFTQWNTRGV